MTHSGWVKTEKNNYPDSFFPLCVPFLTFNSGSDFTIQRLVF